MTPLATVEELAAYSKGQIGADDPRAFLTLNGVSAAIRRYCGWHVVPEQDDVLTVDGPGGRLLSLPTLNLVSVASVVEDGIALAPTDYRWSSDGSVVKNGYWSPDFRSIVATIKHGYDFDDAADVVGVALAVATRQLSSPTGATREQAGQVSVSWAVTAPGVSGGIALLAHERDVLDHFRVVTV